MQFPNRMVEDHIKITGFFYLNILHKYVLYAKILFHAAQGVRSRSVKQGRAEKGRKKEGKKEASKKSDSFLCSMNFIPF